MNSSDATATPKAAPAWLRRYMFCVVCVAVLGMLLMGAEPGVSVLKNTDAKDCYYNLLVQGFRAGQLNLKKDAPPGLARLANPYDPAENAPYIPDVGDMSYYKGKLYLYYGVTPALVLYWPFVAVTGHYLQDSAAALIFCALGYMAGAILLYAIWRRYFPEVNMWTAMAGILIFGLMIAAHESEWVGIRVYEVASSGGFAFAMLALAAIWATLHRPGRRRLWLLLASLAYGLAIASRPNLIFGAIILLIPAIQAWSRGGVAGAKPCQKASESGLILAAAFGPLILIGAGQVIYNAMRFGNPLEFGNRYEVTGLAPVTDIGQFSLHYFWFNTRYYFWEPLRWTSHLPYIRPAQHWATSSGHFGVEQYYGGLLFLYPVAWFALAAPLVWRSRPDSQLRWFILTAFLLFITCALTICLFNIANERYELDFLPALMLLAVIGILELESRVGSRTWRGIARLGFCVLAVCMAMISFSEGLDAYSTANYFSGNVLVNRGLPDEAIARYQRVLAIEPEFAGAYNGLGNALVVEGRTADAIIEYQKALQINANFAEARYDLASCFMREGRYSDALVYFQKATEIAPDSADAHNNFGYCLLQTGRVPEAIVQFQKAVELDPQSPNLRCGLGNALLKAGRRDEAIVQYQKAVELAPDVAGVHYQLASGLMQNGHLDDAIGQYQKAVELEPDSAIFHRDYARALAQKGMTNEASVQYKKAVELDPGMGNQSALKR